MMGERRSRNENEGTPTANRCGWGPYHFTSIDVCPGLVMEMVPPHMHMQVSEAWSAGILATVVCAAPGVHGATVAGIQGMGVSTPKAAAVAEATVGLAGDWHMPKGMMLVMGIKSMMLALGTFSPETMLVGRTTSDEGAIPIVH
jgi:hypothetical protein